VRFIFFIKLKAGNCTTKVNFLGQGFQKLQQYRQTQKQMLLHAEHHQAAFVGCEHSASDFGIDRKLIYDFLLVINTNLHPILHCFQVIADYWPDYH